MASILGAIRGKTIASYHGVQFTRKINKYLVLRHEMAAECIDLNDNVDRIRSEPVIWHPYLLIDWLIARLRYQDRWQYSPAQLCLQRQSYI